MPSHLLYIFCFSSKLFAQDQITSPNVDTYTTIYTTVYFPPQFPGKKDAMTQFIRQNMKYPIEALYNDISGKVYVGFIIEKDGSISNIAILESPHLSLSNETIRLVKSMPKWLPAQDNGEPVRCRFSIAVTFKL